MKKNHAKLFIWNLLLMINLCKFHEKYVCFRVTVQNVCKNAKYVGPYIQFYITLLHVNVKCPLY